MFKKVVVVCGFLFFTHSAVGQVTTATLTGTVRDESRAVMPGVSVTIRNLDTGLARTVISDDQGVYHAPNLPVGHYEAQAELTGFQVTIRSGITLTVGQQAVVDFALKVGEISDKIIVEGEAPLVETNTAAISGLVDEKKIRDLPLNGRDYIQLALLQAGVSARGAGGRVGAVLSGGSGIKLSIAGGRPEHTSFLEDGTNIKSGLGKTPAGFSGTVLGVETIAEFRVLTNSFTAEFGRGAAAGVINAVTKSGTNEFHGNVFEFHRNSALDARNFFDPGEKPPAFKRNQFGFTLGGPIVRDKTFFFGGYEGLRERLGLTIISNVPNETARRGLLPDPQNRSKLVEVGVHPNVRPFLNSFPLPNGRDFGDGRGELVWNFSQPTDEDFFTVKVDHQFNRQHSIFGKYLFDDSSLVTPQSLPSFADTNEGRRQTITLQENSILSSRLLNKFQFGVSRFRLDQDSGAIVNLGPELLFVPAAGVGTLRVGGLNSWGSNTTSAPRLTLTSIYQYSDDLAYTRGAHSLRIGVLVERTHFNADQLIRKRGTFDFDDLNRFLTNQPRVFEVALPGSDGLRRWRQFLLGWYLQDDYKLLSNLTFNLGLRHEFITTPSEADGKVSSLRDVMDPDVTVGDPFFINPSYENLAPRLGLAWDPFGNGRTAVRAGFGVYYEQILTNHFAVSGASMPPFIKIPQVLNPPFPNALDAAATRGTTILRFAPTEFRPRQPYLLQYNLNIQHQIAGDTLLSFAYAGSRGVHLNRGGNINTPFGEILQDGRKFFPETSTLRNPNFRALDFRLFDANSFYNAFTLGVNRRYSKGFQFQASYTVSKLIDESPGNVGAADAPGTGATAMDPYDIHRDRSLSAFDVRQNLTLNYTYEIPLGRGLAGLTGKLAGGWVLAGIINVSSGNPFNITIGSFDRPRNRNQQFSSGPVDRPNLASGFSGNPRTGRAPEQYLSPLAFELQPAGFFGNLGRNAAIGPGSATFDFAVMKTTRLGISEDASIQVKVEAFNLFNRPNFGLPQRIVFLIPNPNVRNANFGRITSTETTSRQLQFALKIIF
ncbi:MAG: TonB-dependent receptor [Acidobacteria bacterium]|nr:TonB-dependent receptor [Acidobacteriota bacterium]